MYINIFLYNRNFILIRGKPILLKKGQLKINLINTYHFR